MNNQNLIIYQFKTLYQILKELEKDLKLNVIEIENKQMLESKIRNLNNYLILTKKKSSFKNQLLFNFSSITILKLIEKINVELMRNQFNDQSNIYINNYLINLNAREISNGNLKLSLTEKEINLILYLYKNNNPIKVEELESNVWKYQSDIETHTVETHIYRLRKKLLKNFLTLELKYLMLQVWEARIGRKLKQVEEYLKNNPFISRFMILAFL